jgi:hypothetical protein
MSKILIIGAGLFGCTIGYELNKVGHQVTIVEKDSDIMMNASKLNHNRVHFGYHYPRSLDTAKQSLDGLKYFTKHYIESMVSGFPNYYMVAKEDSNVTSVEYIEFCEKLKINHEYDNFPPDNLVDKKLISSSIKVYEGIYDYVTLKRLVLNKISRLDLRLNSPFQTSDGYDYVINTSYANVNSINKELGVSTLNLKFQDVVIPIFKMKSDPFGLTIMDGPFCSVMPKGREENRFLLYNPKYSVLSESDENNFDGGDFDIDIIYKESEKYFPFLSEVEPDGYWRTIRALPKNNDDSRLSDIFIDNNNNNVITILSGKVTTCHKIGLELAKML